MKKLSGRPFLVVNFFERPRENVNTSVKGWQSNPANIATFETVAVVDRVGSKHATTPIIIDLVEGKAIRNSTNKPDDQLIEHYIARYEDTIMSALKAWATDEVLNKTKQEETTDE